MTGWTRKITFAPRWALVGLVGLVVLGCESQRDEAAQTEASSIDQDAPEQRSSDESVPPDRAAQAGQSAPTPAEEGEASAEPERAPTEQPENTLIQGTMRGTVRALDLAQGAVTVEGGGQQGNLKAHPSDLAPLELGEQVALPFESYADGSRWLETRGNARQLLETSTSIGQLSGEVEAIDVDEGVLAVAGQTFRAHPEQLRAIRAGDAVSLSYADVEDTPWVAELEPRAEASAESAPAEAPEAEQAQAQLQTEGSDDEINWYFEPPG